MNTSQLISWSSFTSETFFLGAWIFTATYLLLVGRLLKSRTARRATWAVLTFGIIQILHLKIWSYPTDADNEVRLVWIGAWSIATLALLYCITGHKKHNQKNWLLHAKFLGSFLLIAATIHTILSPVTSLSPILSTITFACATAGTLLVAIIEIVNTTNQGASDISRKWWHALLTLFLSFQCLALLPGLFSEAFTFATSNLIGPAGLLCLTIPALLKFRYTLISQNAHHDNSVGELLTQLRKNQAELNEAKARSDRLAALQRDFLATMSHELRTPIASLIGIARVLGANDAIPARERRDMGTIERLALMVLEIVDEGLAYVRERGQKPNLQSKNVNIRTLLRDLDSVGKWLARQQGNSFRLMQPKSFPSSLEFDERRVRQIIINLLSNAGRYCQGGEITLGLQVAYASGQIYLEWMVTDTGRGFDSSEIDKMFLPFVKSRDSHGLGLGMTLVKKLAEEMGGSVKVLSTKGSGSYFLVRMPAGLSRQTPDSVLEDGELNNSIPSKSEAITEPLPLVSISEISLNDLEELKRLAKLGQLSKIEEWIQWAKNKELSDASRKFVGRIETACEEIEMDQIAMIATQALTNSK